MQCTSTYSHSAAFFSLPQTSLMMIFFLFMQSAHVSSERAVYRIFPATHKKKLQRDENRRKKMFYYCCVDFSVISAVYKFFFVKYTQWTFRRSHLLSLGFFSAARFFFIMEKCEIHVFFGWCENKIKFDQKTVNEKWTHRERKKKVFWDEKNTHMPQTDHLILSIPPTQLQKKRIENFHFFTSEVTSTMHCFY